MEQCVVAVKSQATTNAFNPFRCQIKGEFMEIRFSNSSSNSNNNSNVSEAPMPQEVTHKIVKLSKRKHSVPPVDQTQEVVKKPSLTVLKEAIREVIEDREKEKTIPGTVVRELEPSHLPQQVKEVAEVVEDKPTTQVANAGSKLGYRKIETIPNWELLAEQLFIAQSSWADVAGYFGVSVSTVKRHERLREIREKALATGRIAMRQSMYKRGTKDGNVEMLKFLGKHHLDMVDNKSDTENVEVIKDDRVDKMIALAMEANDVRED